MGSTEGAMKVAATRVGLSLEEYRENQARGLRWCCRCKQWHERSAFGLDAKSTDGVARSCLASRATSGRNRYVKKGRKSMAGRRFSEPRDGDKLQARGRVNVLVRTGRLPRPDSLLCADCGHIGPDRRHEYDHHLGYTAEHHEDVQPVCSVCHHGRSRQRGESPRLHSPDGRFMRNP